jgi:hypothetical protein
MAGVSSLKVRSSRRIRGPAGIRATQQGTVRGTAREVEALVHMGVGTCHDAHLPSVSKWKYLCRLATCFHIRNSDTGL